MRDIGKNIRELRSRAGLSQNELAERLFVTRQTVSNYETGKTRPDVEQILRLAEIFETDANAVLYGAPSGDKQVNAGFRTALGGGICVGMTALYFFLRRASDAYVGNTFQILPPMMVTALLRPLMLVSFGWFFMQLLLLTLPGKFPQKPWMRRVRWCLLAVLGALLLAPCAICTAVLVHLELPTLLEWPALRLLRLNLYAGYAYPIVGMALQWFGCSSRGVTVPAAPDCDQK